MVTSPGPWNNCIYCYIQYKASGGVDRVWVKILRKDDQANKYLQHNPEKKPNTGDFRDKNWDDNETKQNREYCTTSLADIIQYVLTKSSGLLFVTVIKNIAVKDIKMKEIYKSSNQRPQNATGP